MLRSNAAMAQGAKPPLVPNELDSYIAVKTDGTVQAFFGKMDMGQGLFTAIGQIVAKKTRRADGVRQESLMGDTDKQRQSGRSLGLDTASSWAASRIAPCFAETAGAACSATRGLRRRSSAVPADKIIVDRRHRPRACKR